MIISYSKKFIYFKSVKTAGSSIESNLWDSCDPLKDIRPKTVESPIDYNLPKKPSLVNHSLPLSIKSFLPNAIWNNYTKIVCIRNPWDVMVSWFHNRITSGNEYNEKAIEYTCNLWDQKSPNKYFLEWLKTHSYPNSNYYFNKNDLTADFYIRYEHLQEDFSKICSDLGLVYKEIYKFKTQFRQIRIPYQIYYNKAAKQAIRCKAKKEINYFGYKF
jgi:hypothetical protein